MSATNMLFLCLLVFPLLSLSQTVVFTTESDGFVSNSTVYDASATTSGSSSSSYPSSTLYSSYTTGVNNVSPSSISFTLPVLPTVPYTGQSILVGTCTIPQFTILKFPDGGSLEVPLIGCSDDRPDCCPSLNLTCSPPTETGSSASASGPGGNGDQSTISSTGTTPTLTPTGVISMLSAAPLAVCPSGMVDMDPVCCPIGFSKYGQSIIGNLPCVTTVTSTIFSPPPSVLASITSVISASMESASTTTTPTISVIVNEVFALGLPCADNPEEKHSGLSTGAKAGIGVGVGVAALLLILALWACIAIRHHRRRKVRKLEAANTASVDPKHMSVATTLAPGSPNLQQRTDPMGHCGLSGYAQPHGYTPAFGYMQAQSAHDTYGNYGVHPVPVGMPMHMPGPQGYNGIPPPGSQSPPPMYPQYKDIPEVDGTSVVPKPAHQGDVQILGHLSDTTSQDSMTDRTAINSFSGNMGQAAELSSGASTIGHGH